MYATLTKQKGNIGTYYKVFAEDETIPNDYEIIVMFNEDNYREATREAVKDYKDLYIALNAVLSFMCFYYERIIKC